MIRRSSPIIRIKDNKAEVDWPESDFPLKVVQENQQWKSWGYILDFDGMGPDNYFTLLQSGNYQQLISRDADFLLLTYNKITHKTLIAVSINGAFPLFFTCRNREVILSPLFGEVVRQVPSPSIEIDELMDYLCTEYSLFFTDKTFISQIRRLPPGCVLEIGTKLNWKIIEPIDLAKILYGLDNPMPKKDFARRMMDQLSTNISHRLATIKQFPKSCDLSSGFDCDLIAYLLTRQIDSRFGCYSFYIRQDVNDTDPQLVKDFATMHHLSLKQLDISDIHDFHDKEDLEWTINEFFPSSHSQKIGMAYRKFRTKDTHGKLTSFTGHGGDEFFISYGINQYMRNAAKTESNFAALTLEGGGKNILTAQYRDYFQSLDRFSKKHIYVNKLPAASIGFLGFSLDWKLGLWNINPFINLDMLKLGQQIPRDNGIPLHKHLIMKELPNIFVSDQFRVKLPFDDQVKRGLEARKDLLLEVLRNSVLGDLGIIDSQKMILEIEAGKLRPLFDQAVAMFINTIRLEIFLQGNNITRAD